MSQPHEMSAWLREPASDRIEAAACPACGRSTDPVLFAWQPPIAEPIARLIQAQYPRWERARGACPACVYEAVQQWHKQRSTYSLQHKLQLPYPVYAPDDARLLPMPVRLRAHPQYTGRGITIAFLDSGFYPHPDLTRPRNRILRYVDCTDNEPVEKSNFRKRHVSSWHGLMTSCVAAGNGFMSDHLYRGIASRANLVLVKTGTRRSGRIGERAIYRALSWVMANANRYDIRIVNISLGGDCVSTDIPTELDELVEEAVARGMVVVVASGNSGHERIAPPASALSAITVGGLNDQNTLDARSWNLYHSNYGRGVDGRRKPELVAPAIWLPAPMLPNSETHNEGMFLWRLMQASDRDFERALETKFAQNFFKQSTMRLPFDAIRQKIRGRMIEQKFIHAHYQHVDGTSFAAPIVSSVVAQMLEANPRLTPAQVKQILIATAERIEHAPAEQQGFGVVNAAHAVAVALRTAAGPLAGFPISPHATPWAISFTYHDPEARSVALVGSFNDWRSHGYHLHHRAHGVWQITIPPLPAGEYAYKFVVDQKRWINDPENSHVMDDGYGGLHSLLKC